jgi:hypothetical protein
VLAAYPGVVVGDTESQLFQVVVGNFNDGNPPHMTALWMLLNWLWPGPQGMFLLQCGLFFAGLYAFVRALQAGLAPGWSGLIGLGLAASPATLVYHGFILKDVQFAASLFFAFTLLLVVALTHDTRSTRPNMTAWSLALAALTYGTATRHNGAPGVIPLALFAAWVLGRVWGTGFSRWRVAIVGGGLWLAIVVAIQGTMPLLGTARAYIFHVILAHDVAGISVRTGQHLVPTPYRSNHYDMAELSRRYSPLDINAIYFGHVPPPMRYNSDPAAVQELSRAWLSAVSSRPDLYLEHRWILTHTILVDSFTGVDPEALAEWRNLNGRRLAQQASAGDTATQRLRRAALAGLGNAVADAARLWIALWEGTALHRFGGWMALATAMLWLVDRLVAHLPDTRPYRSLHTWRVALLACCSSAWLYFAPFPFIIPNASPRYFYWCLLASQVTVLGATVLALARLGWFASAPCTPPRADEGRPT